MVCLDGKDDWIFVTKQQDSCDWPKPVLFDDVEEAFRYADTFAIYGKEKNVKVVTYDDI